MKSVAAVLVALAMITLTTAAQAADLKIVNYELVSKTKVSKTVYDYTYRASITNNGMFDLANVTANAESTSPSMTMMDSSLTFGDVSAGATVRSSDVFTVRLSSTTPFNEGNLQWGYSSQKKYVGKAIVATCGGNYTSPLQAMNDLASWCRPAGDSRSQCLMKIMPGVYDIGSNSLPMQPYIDIEGAGIDVTTLRGNTSLYASGVVLGASYAEIRSLTIQNYTTVNFSRGIYNKAASPTISNLKIVVSWAWSDYQGYAENRGILNEDGSAPLIKKVAIEATGMHACGVISVDSFPTIEDSSITVSLPGKSHYISGVESIGESVTTIKDSKVTVIDGSDNIGLYLRTGSAKVSNTSLTARGGGVSSSGIGAGDGVHSTPYTIEVDNSTVHGDTRAMGFASNFSTTVRDSILSGANSNIVNGPLVCQGVYDSCGNYFASTCP